MTFNDGDEICGPNSYMRMNGAWLLTGGEGQDSLSDATVGYMLNIKVPVVKKDVSKKVKNSGMEVKAYYVYKEVE